MTSRLVPMALVAAFAAVALTPAQATPQAQSFAQRFLAEEPEIRKLLEAMNPSEAQSRLEALLAEPRLPFDAKDANTTHLSSLRALYYSRAFLLAVQTAEFAGQWEKAVGYAREGISVAKENHEQCQKVLEPMASGFRKQAENAKAFLETNSAKIKELEGQHSVSEEEWNLLERSKVERMRLADGEKWSKFFSEDMDRAKADFERWPKDLAELMEKKIADQEKEITGYKAAKGSKIKWAEAVAGSPQYMAAYTQPREKVAFLQRLIVLAPESSKIRRALEVALGKTEPDSAGTKGKKK